MGSRASTLPRSHVRKARGIHIVEGSAEIGVTAGAGIDGEEQIGLIGVDTAVITEAVMVQSC